MTAVARLREVQDSNVEKIDSALFDLVKQRSFRRGKFRLSSGIESDLYFNLKPTMMSPLGAELAARAFLFRIWNEEVDFVGGLEMGAVPVIGSLAAISQCEGRPVKTFFVRKKKKEHGTMDLIEGLGPGEALIGMRVLIVDDVATSGGSILIAINAAREAGAIVESALVLVNRDEGAEQTLKQAGVRLLSVLHARDFL
jgi:orotate phosphoribosyltransferase